MDVKTAKAAYKAELLSSAGIHYDRLSIIRKPLLIIDNVIACLSLEYFAQQIGDQLYWKCLEHLDKKDRKLGDKFTRFYGELFHVYISEIFNRIYSERYRSEVSFTVGNECGKLDGIILYPNSVIIIETKSSQLKYNVKTTGDHQIFEGDLNKIMLGTEDGAKQLSVACKAIRQGVLNTVFGVDISRHVIYPVLVLTEILPLEPLSWDYYASKIEEGGWFSEQNIKPLSIFDVEEVELIEAVSESSMTLEEMLYNKTKRQIDCAMPMKNYILQQQTKGTRTNKTLIQSFKTELNEASKIIFGKELEIKNGT